jgi:hypothetical protein
LAGKKVIQIPPHRIIHSIEANCAYWKQGYREPVTRQSVARIMNVYHSFTDPYQFNTISESLDRTFLLMHREQIYLQKRASWAHLLRSWVLFVHDGSMEKSSQEFYFHFGINMDQWIKVCFLCWVISVHEGGGSFIVNFKDSPNIGITQTIFETFLKFSSRSPEDVGHYFLDMRKNEPYEFHSLIRSCFFETPIVKFS